MATPQNASHPVACPQSTESLHGLISIGNGSALHTYIRGEKRREGGSWPAVGSTLFGPLRQTCREPKHAGDHVARRRSPSNQRPSWV